MLTFTYPFIPPSLNRIYNVANNKIYMNTAAKVYKDSFIDWCKTNMFKEVSKLRVDKYDCLSLTVTIYFPYEELVNSKYGKDKRVKSPFKRIDIDNRIKLLQDCVAAIIGGDDKQIFNVNFTKKVANSAKEKRVEVTIVKENLYDFVGELKRVD